MRPTSPRVWAPRSSSPAARLVPRITSVRKGPSRQLAGTTLSRQHHVPDPNATRRGLGALNTSEVRLRRRPLVVLTARAEVYELVVCVSSLTASASLAAEAVAERSAHSGHAGPSSIAATRSSATSPSRPAEVASLCPGPRLRVAITAVAPLVRRPACREPTLTAIPRGVLLVLAGPWILADRCAPTRRACARVTSRHSLGATRRHFQSGEAVPPRRRRAPLAYFTIFSRTCAGRRDRSLIGPALAGRTPPALRPVTARIAG